MIKAAGSVQDRTRWPRSNYVRKTSCHSLASEDFSYIMPMIVIHCPHLLYKRPAGESRKRHHGWKLHDARAGGSCLRWSSCGAARSAYFKSCRGKRIIRSF
jgi:hypothetical protein